MRDAEGACIIKTDPSERTNCNWASDPRLRQISVAVCTADCTLIGTAHLMAQHRLLDELNAGFVASLHRLGRDFMHLTEVRILYPGGAKDVALTSHVRKSSILFVAEKSPGLPERNGTKDAKGHLMRVKKPLTVKAFLPPYTLEGKMHVALWQELAQGLDSDNRFLPITDVAITPDTLGGESAFSFVAINKDQILHLCELSEALQRLREDAQRALEGEQRAVTDLVTSNHP